MSWETKIPARLIDFANRVHPNNNTIIGLDAEGHIHTIY